MHKTILIGIVMFSCAVLFVPHSGYADWWTSSPPALTDHANYDNTNIKQIQCPSPGDQDQDGICDVWEFGPNNPEPGTGFTGLHVLFNDTSTNPPTRYEYKLACDPAKTGDCPSPQHKDIYLEIDWMSHHAPDHKAIGDVIAAFRNSPMHNLDQIDGVNLHIQNGTNSTSGDIGTHYNLVKVTTVSSSSYVKFVTLKQNFFGTTDEQNGLSSICPSSVPGTVSHYRSTAAFDCLTAKRQVFHWGIFVEEQSGQTTSSGWAEIPGNDFMVSLGSFGSGNGNIDTQEGALMHELGHNLGLRHGGNQGSLDESTVDDFNCKPNYQSVMSYTYEFASSYDICRPLDYSHVAQNSLNEGNLNNDGLQTDPYPVGPYSPPPGIPGEPSSCPVTPGEKKIWFSAPNLPTQSSTTGQASIKWDVTGPDTGYIQNLNGLGISGCTGTSTNTMLNGFDDWHNLNFVFQSSSNFFGGPIPADVESQNENGTNAPDNSPACVQNEIRNEPQSPDGSGEMACSEATHNLIIIPHEQQLDKISKLMHNISSQISVSGQDINKTIGDVIADAKDANTHDDLARFNSDLQKLDDLLNVSGSTMSNSDKAQVHNFLESSRSGVLINAPVLGSSLTNTGNMVCQYGTNLDGTCKPNPDDPTAAIVVGSVVTGIVIAIAVAVGLRKH